MMVYVLLIVMGLMAYLCIWKCDLVDILVMALTAELNSLLPLSHLSNFALSRSCQLLLRCCHLDLCHSFLRYLGCSKYLQI